MIWCKCINKIRDKNGIITDYCIVSVGGEQRVVSKNQLKTAIANNQVALVNLKLSKDGKLMDRAIEEEAQLTKNLTFKDLQDDKKQEIIQKNEKMMLKANMLGIAAQMDSYNVVVGCSNVDRIVIPPNARGADLRALSKFRGKTLVVPENTEWGRSLPIGMQHLLSTADILVIRDEALCAHVNDHKITADNIVFDFSNINEKTLDIIFKTYKDEVNAFTNKLREITIVNSRLDEDTAVGRCRKILLRQKPSSVVDRRAFDLITYLRLIRTVKDSYNDNKLKDLTKQYIDELEDKMDLTLRGFGGTSKSFETFIRNNKDSIKELIEYLRSDL